MHPLRVLILEDQPADRELALYELRRAGFQVNAWSVEREDEYLQCLQNETIDVILADYTLPQFNALRALQLMQQQRLNIPFIVVSGTISEEVAVQCIKLGASDYLLKDRLTRLGPAIHHALEQKRLSEEKHQADTLLNLLSSAVQQSTEGIAVADLEGNLIFVNNAFAQMHGYRPQELTQTPLSRLHVPEELNRLTQAYRDILLVGELSFELWHLRRDSSRFPGLHQISLLRDEHATPIGMIIALRDITERKQAEAALEFERALLARRVEERTAELRQANVELARASRLKDEFLANMSHELRTPLNAILGMSEALLEEVYGTLTERQRRSLERIQESGRHLLELINDILDISKIEAGKLTLDINTISIDAVCQSSLQLVRQIALKKQLQIHYQPDPQAQMMQADQRRLKQVLVNLLSNAVKFTPEGGSVGLKVVLRPENEAIDFTVWDTGIGIAPEDLPRLFQPFIQLDSSLSRHHAGTGLGLALVRRLVDMQGGGVLVASQPGQGSRFTVSLPWREGFADFQPRPDQQPDTIQPIPQPLTGEKTILLAEDNDQNVATLCDYLEAKGYKMLVARAGNQALEMAQTHLPHLILMDVQMPGMDGIETTRQLREIPETAKIPVIIITALAMPGDRDRCLKAGANDYISKPIHLKMLLNRIEFYLYESSA
ncbi:MAG: hypothetical protein OHK0052_16720 [Anaerolineales bacterium]